MANGEREHFTRTDWIFIDVEGQRTVSSGRHVQRRYVESFMMMTVTVSPRPTLRRASRHKSTLDLFSSFPRLVILWRPELQ